MISRPFVPHYGSNQNGTLAAAGTATLTIERQDTTVRISNSGTGDLYIRTYSSAQGTAPVANNTCLRILANSSVLMFADYSQDRMSLFSAAGTVYDVITGTGGV